MLTLLPVSDVGKLLCLRSCGLISLREPVRYSPPLFILLSEADCTGEKVLMCLVSLLQLNQLK